jgi:hypothetical protein
MDDAAPGRCKSGKIGAEHPAYRRPGRSAAPRSSGQWPVVSGQSDLSVFIDHGRWPVVIRTDH